MLSSYCGKTCRCVKRAKRKIISHCLLIVNISTTKKPLQPKNGNMPLSTSTEFRKQICCWKTDFPAGREDVEELQDTTV